MLKKAQNKRSKTNKPLLNLILDKQMTTEHFIFDNKSKQARRKMPL
jgi:hypothetical protein